MNAEEDIKVRLAVEADLTRIAELTEIAYRPWTELLGYPPFPVTADHASYQKATLTWVAVDMDGHMPALIEMELEPGTWSIFNVAVDPKAQGQGLGHMMLDFVEREGIWCYLALYEPENDPEYGFLQSPGVCGDR